MRVGYEVLSVLLSVFWGYLRLSITTSSAVSWFVQILWGTLFWDYFVKLSSLCYCFLSEKFSFLFVSWRLYWRRWRRALGKKRAIDRWYRRKSAGSTHINMGHILPIQLCLSYWLLGFSESWPIVCSLMYPQSLINSNFSVIFTAWVIYCRCKHIWLVYIAHASRKIMSMFKRKEIRKKNSPQIILRFLLHYKHEK